MPKNSSASSSGKKKTTTNKTKALIQAHSASNTLTSLLGFVAATNK
jgi:hypothetical protein